MSRTVVITGASSGIGHALAFEYAKHGARLALLGRDNIRLEKTAVACRELGAEVSLGMVDVRDRAAMHDYLTALDARSPVDLLIANAGILRGSSDGKSLESNHDSFAVIDTNVIGLVNTVHPLLPGMIARRRGQVAILSSIAGLIPLAWCPSYAASKAAGASYGLSLREALRPYGILVSVICPGFVSTPMTEQLSGATTHQVSAEYVSYRIRRGLEKNKPIIAFPASLAFLARLGALVPELFRRLGSRSYAVSNDDRL
jgi:short-subunit dehydrogenase